MALMGSSINEVVSTEVGSQNIFIWKSALLSKGWYMMDSSKAAQQGVIKVFRKEGIHQTWFFNVCNKYVEKHVLHAELYSSGVRNLLLDI